MSEVVPDLEMLYQSRRNQPWSINEHMETLRRYGAQCEVITEFGTDVGFSAVAFLAARPRLLRCYDIQHRAADIALIAAVARAHTDTVFKFYHQSSLEATFTATDLLFVDSLHDYEQVRQELALHGHKARKYLIFHDTVERGTTDETPSDHPVQGIQAAIDEYMAAHPEWTLAEQFTHQYGLAIYHREP